MVTIFKNIYDKEPHYITINAALARIKDGKSRNRIEEIRRSLDKEKADVLKRQLPSICFSGKFGSDRKDESLIEHSGYIVLDFDNVDDVSEKAANLIEKPFIYAMWLSPRGNGLKVLIKIADSEKHREHFSALQDVFPEVDRSGVNVSRVCYESYDPNIYINPKAATFNKIKTIEKIEVKEALKENQAIFQNLLVWLSNRNDAFVSGERNTFIFKLASACSRFGLGEDDVRGLILTEYPSSNDFTSGECEKAIKSAYRANKSKHGTACFEKDVLIDKITKQEIKIDAAIYDESIRPRDVIYGADVKGDALHIFQNGYPSVQKLGLPLDEYFKSKRGEITLLTGIGNYGKSSFHKWYQLMRVLKFGEKFASFSPEDNPPQEYYFDFVEMLLGCDCSPYNNNRPGIDVFSNAYDFVSKYIFYIYPSLEASPTPEYVKERFLELIIKEKIAGVTIDPFNQMSHDYSKTGGRSDKYLELVLGDFSRFAQMNNVYFTIIAHPKMMTKNQDGNYPCPDLFDVADGAMWNNKVDNLLVYHRPLMQVAPEDPIAEFHSKKIRRQKTIGRKGCLALEYIRNTRRFEFSGIDYMAKIIKEKGLSFKKEQAAIQYEPQPFKNEYLENLSGNPF